jgi:hypothetical protein
VKIFQTVFIFILIVMSIFLTGNGDADPGIIPITKFTSLVMNKGAPDGWSLEKKTANR